MASLAGFICNACGTQFPETAAPPALCPICEDVRQYVPRSGQSWTTLEQLCAGHTNAWRELEPGLLSIETSPDFAIGQRALLLRTAHGNFLWDCLSLVDEATVALIQGLGGLRGIAISHPHYYTTMLEWSAAFDHAPIHLHAADRKWVMRQGASIDFWEGEQKELAPGVTLIRCGGHFAGGTVLHWAGGADARGALLSGDILQVTPDGMVSFMFSYPNLIPLPPASVQRITRALDPFAYDRVYGAFSGREVGADARSIVAQSAARYLESIAERGAMNLLETERLILRPITLADAPLLLAVMNEPSFIEHVADRGLRTTAEAKRYIAEKILPSFARFGFGMYVVALKDTGASIGTCGLFKRETMEDVDIGYAFLREFWGRGFAYEAAEAVLAYGRDVLLLPKIVAMTAPNHHRSIKLLEKLGLRFQRMIALPGFEGERKLFA